ncbi:hypothetical protein NE172_11865 [Clostridium botulinum]|uniref:ATP synthase subunit I n=1 Tax=Clostridium botulinum TaxID=1491 RepID=A0A6B4JNG3_CLOBO|nr:hypothetical protein [Clostridium botulinum]EES50609.1 conserved hypothetical protein [Clostridium botulinum E1 str. 'BoNT E Beluga']MBY6762057.1 hypothetical protein [Clostridium botulinum]MBY6920630.1 hypothetical protein [Clostridium botulinum]MCR1131654.1 hypothetical protein [Clostridium botulinum]NFH70363.1 hypothetical protein [Clostridium botulinum]
MNREPIKLLKDMIKLDLRGGLLVSLIISILFSFKDASIYFIGIIVSLISFMINVYIIISFLGYNNRNKYITMSVPLKIGIVILASLPFIKNVEYISFYMCGFISHYVFLTFSSIKSEKGSV